MSAEFSANGRNSPKVVIAGGRQLWPHLLDACQFAPVLLHGHTKIENTVRYLGVDVEDALLLAERTEI